MRLLTGLVVVLAAYSAHAQPARWGGGEAPSAPYACVSESDRAGIERASAEYALRRGKSPGWAPGTRTVDADPYTIYPMGGTLFEDVFLNNYVDLIRGTGILDWDCTDHTYEGHGGHDAGLRSFGEQAIGVPVFAVQDGVVVAAHDGEDDMNTEALSQPSNYVVINHGAGRECFYFHLKKNSVAVSVDEVVTAGQQIGLVGSSGNSTGPHLHFETQQDSDDVEPNAGDCNPGDSLWSNQIPIRRDTYLQDLGITNASLSGVSYPDPLPSNPHIKVGDPYIYVWFQVPNLPANSTRRHVFKRPDGITVYDIPGQWSAPFYRWSWWWFSFVNPGTPSTLGTWTYELYVNGSLLTSAPFEMGANGSASVNRVPEAIEVALEPETPTEQDVLVARVVGDLVLDDLDYDIVEYEYVWTVDGVELRSVVSAGRSDALPHHTAPAGSTVVIAVTPSDGAATGPTAALEFEIAGGPLDPSEVWVDFGYTGTEVGASFEPVNTLGEAIFLVEPNGTIKIKGDSPDATSSENLFIAKPMRVDAVNGVVRIGIN